MVAGYGAVYKVPDDWPQSSSQCPKFALFLCHRGEVKDWVGALAFVLGKLEVPCFFDKSSIGAGTASNVETMRAACHGSAAALVVVSPNFFQSKWCNLELNTLMWRRDTVADCGQTPAQIHPVFWKVSRDSFPNEPHMGTLKRIGSNLVKLEEEASKDFVMRILLEVLSLPHLRKTFLCVVEAHQQVENNPQKIYTWLSEYADQLGQERVQRSGLSSSPPSRSGYRQVVAHTLLLLFLFVALALAGWWTWSGTLFAGIPRVLDRQNHADTHLPTDVPVTPLRVQTHRRRKMLPQSKQPTSIIGTPPAKDRWYVDRLPEGEAIGRAFGKDLLEHKNVVLMGPPGSGKSMIAVNYALNNKHRYVSCLWLNGATLLSSFSAVAKELALPVSKGNAEPNAEESRLAVLVWIAQHLPCLIIVDNVDDILDEGPVRWLPSKGHVLVTSRDQRWDRRRFTAIKVTLFSEEQAVQLLGEDSPAAHTLVRRLDCLPLALGVVRSTVEMEREGRDFGATEYLTLLQKRLSDRTGYEKRILKRSTLTLDAVFASSIERLPNSSRMLLQRLAYVQPDWVPLTLVSHWTKGTDVDDATDHLLKAHLVWRVGRQQDIALHRVLQGCIRRRQGAPYTALVDVVNSLDHHFEFDEDLHNLSVTRIWAPHAEVIAAHALEIFPVRDRHETDSAGKVVQVVGRGLYHLGCWHRLMGRYQQANQTLHQALDIATVVHGDDHAELAHVLDEIGAVMLAKNSTDSALSYFRRALKIDRTHRGERHHTVAVRLHNIGTVLSRQGRMDEALDHYHRALKIDEEARGRDHPKVATQLSNIGTLLSARGDFEGALKHHLRALAIDEKVLGVNHLASAPKLFNVGAVLFKKNMSLDIALEYFRRALAVEEPAYGRNHPSTAATLKWIDAIETAAAYIAELQSKLTAEEFRELNDTMHILHACKFSGHDCTQGFDDTLSRLKLIFRSNADWTAGFAQFLPKALVSEFFSVMGLLGSNGPTQCSEDVKAHQPHDVH